jgi:integrase
MVSGFLSPGVDKAAYPEDLRDYLESIEAVEDKLSNKVAVPEVSADDEVRDIELEPERANRILDYLEKYHYASREHVVWLLHCETGRRPGGIHSLDLDDYHNESEQPYLEFRHRPDETRLKNDHNGETDVNICEAICEVLDDYIRDSREDVTSDNGRRPLLTTRNGRLSKSAMQKYVYKWSRPCEITGECPHNRKIDECAGAESAEVASKCPSSCSPYALRHGYITEMRRQSAPRALLSDRCDVSEEVLEKYYDERSIEERREVRRDVLDEIGGGYVDD